jgi:hypothetical protein
MQRRTFIKKSFLTGSGVLLSTSIYRNILGANDDIHLGVIGFRSKGKQHIDVFRQIPGVRIKALCEVDEDTLKGEVKGFTDRQEKVETYTDVRHLLDNKDIDAVVVATPNHWHSLIAIWACQAGKDVYVEKPVSHNIWEGRKLVEAARKYNRIVQAGTQNRSDTGFREAVAYLKSGQLGKILWAHGLWYKERESIGKVNGPQEVPPTIDYNLWSGPAPLVPLMRKNLHYDWHWFWSTGNGDMGNLGAHQIDDCRFALELEGLPKRVISYGGRFVFDDDGETPNTQFTLYEYEKAPVIIEIRNLPVAKGTRAMDHLRGVRMGNIIQCEDGYFAGGRGGGWIYDNNNKKLKQFPGDGGGEHQANFIQAVRSRKKSDLNAEILEGHLSSVLCHMSNISYCMGEKVPPEKITEQINHNHQALETMERIFQHLKKNEVNLQETPAILGPWLEIDQTNEMFVGEYSGEANTHLKRNVYRKPFVVPEVV